MTTSPHGPRCPARSPVDVAIVGAGLTGLWTAYYLHRADPSLRIVVLEQEVAGFGASGRNGGWCSALFPTSWDALVAASSAGGALRMHRAMQATVREVGRVAEAEGIDAALPPRRDADPGPHPAAAGSRCAPTSRPRTPVGSPRRTSACWAPTRRAAVLGAGNVLGGVFTPHCAAVHPARLVRGLARVVEAAGVPIFERTRCAPSRPARVRDRRRARCGRRSCCAPRRATRRGWPASGARSRRCTR